MPKKLVGEVDDLRVSLPLSLINYLNYIAKDSTLGASANDIASHLLVEEVQRLVREGEHERKLPQLDLRPPPKPKRRRRAANSPSTDATPGDPKPPP
jgi:hypothetical protein